MNEDISVFKMVMFHGHVSFLEGMSIQDQLPFVLGWNNYPPRNSSWTHLPPLERRKQQKYGLVPKRVNSIFPIKC